ncbi:hypothetical protein [Hymenobacter nivis]|uniref:Uncharacterized protein n=1 Tax=Hymenobacter nivis TaxID=1850093 RepID=A0A502GFJ5_9BACT|nr:hypothetical protein [Hymenobacter nivis]TPG59473.1 hypothetical protein EAH73_21415 [Hymenobacter nivis]
MTLNAFDQLPYGLQLATVFETGTYLARRWEEEDGVNLYHLPGGFFVELYYDTLAEELVRLRSFSSTEPLEDYAASVRLPEGWT